MQQRQVLRYVGQTGVIVGQALAGIVFLFSGLTKANDPLGMTILMQDYLSVWGLQIEPWSVTVTCLAVVMAIVEVVLGAYLVIGSSRRRAAQLLLLIMVPMTGLTLWTTLTDAVPECGCFGSALSVTNAHSLLKNIALLMIALVLCYRPQWMYRLPGAPSRVLLTTFAGVGVLVMSFWTWHREPLVDFTPYKVGTDITAAMMGEYAVVNGQSVEVTPPTIREFALTTAEGEDVTDDILLSTDTIVLLTIPVACNADTGNSDRMNTLWDESLDEGYDFYLVMADGPEEAERFKDRTGLVCPTLFASREMLQTIVRANPGIVVLHEGHIVRKGQL